MRGEKLIMGVGGDPSFPKALHQILTFVYFLAHQIGIGIFKLINLILPSAKLPADLVDPIGFLAFLTIFLLLFKLAKKIAWIIIIMGWVLIVIRILFSIFK
ncbi:MAG: hypothetical protein N3B16_00515 [Candidatus Aminicenantes bacterium]|nr:hypothetical protein [Candidatus Aminicenantes bacterium]